MIPSQLIQNTNDKYISTNEHMPSSFHDKLNVLLFIPLNIS